MIFTPTARCIESHQLPNAHEDVEIAKLSSNPRCFRKKSRRRRSSRRSKTTGYLVFKIRMIYHHQVGRELGRLPQPRHRNVRQEGEF